MPKQARGISRRSFITGTAVLTTAGLLAGCSANNETMAETGGDAKATPAESPDELFPGVCSGNCGGGCWLNVHVRDGQVVRTSARDFPDTAYNRICPRGATHVGRIYSSKRVLYPMKRVGERGTGEFERISWDDAIQTIASEWKRITDEVGPQGFGMEWGSGNYQLAHGTCNGFSSMWRLLNITGASEVPLDVDAGVGFGVQHAHGGLPTGNGVKDRINAKTQVMWGCNPPNALPQIMHFLMEAKENGTRYIVIDPLFDTNAAMADWWIPVKAGTDGALAMGVLYELFNNGWITEDAIKMQSNCPFLVKEDGKFLRMSDLGVEPTMVPNPMTGEDVPNDPVALWDASANAAVPFSEAKDPAYQDVSEVNGIKVRTVYEIFMESVNNYPPEKASELCGVKVEDIKELARVYHEDGPVSTEMMQGMNHYRNAHYATWPMVLISMLTGNTGAKGASYGQTEEYLIQMTQSNAAAPMPEGAPGQGRHIPVPLILEATKTGLAGDGIPLKGLFIHGSNPASTFAQHENTLEWMGNLEFLVVSDMYLTETAKQADIVLPAAHWFEKEDVGWLFATHPYLSYNAKAVEPQGEAKADFEIFGLLAEALGYGDMWPESAEAYISEVFDTDTMKALNVSLERIREEGAVNLRPGTEDYVSDTSATLTETGRVYVYQEEVLMSYPYSEKVDESLEHVPQFVEGTFMGEGTEHRKEYPFHVIGEKMRTHTHTQWSDCDFVKEFEPEPIVRINPDDAAELGIKEGDAVKLSNEFGYVVMKCVFNPGLRPKTVSSGRSWNAEDFIDGHFANICSIGFNQVCANQAFNDCSVKIEKA